MYNWTYTTNQTPYYTTSISCRETATKSSGTFEFQSGSLPKNALAQTERLLYQNLITPWNQNWGWARITLDEAEMNTINSYQQLGTVTHEVGHAMGLAHCPDTGRIMCQLGSGRFVFLPQVYDCQTVNHLY
ncbi:MAG: matrixin family metalloprotease [Clostridiales bacterium]|nr:matrixin family metalloprotease [Clostridiales bacterium]